MSPGALPSWQWLHQDGALAISLLLLLPLLAAAVLWRSRHSSTAGCRCLPPSPPKLPLIGNLHQLGSCPHRSLAALSRTHGPLMLLRLGRVPALVVSSVDVLEEIMTSTAFADRPQMEAIKELFYGCKDLAFCQHGEHWKKMRKVFSLHLLGTKRLQSCKLAREEEVAFMVEKIERMSSSSGMVDLRAILQGLLMDLVARLAIHGRRTRDESRNKVLCELVKEAVTLLWSFHVGDYFPSLRWLSTVTGLDSRLRLVSQKLDHVLEAAIEDHLRRSEGNDQPHLEETFVDALLALQKDPSAGLSLTTEIIKALIMDILLAGTDTTAITLEWAMVELIRSSAAMKRAQAEVREIAGAKPAVEEADTVQMNYLRAVIKETLRLHPPSVLLPRQCSGDTRIGGYDIPKQTRVFINAWAIMRDSRLWEAPEEFRPERFLQVRPVDFQFIPFGAGRRICPGYPFALPVMELALANLLHRFDWELPDGLRGEDLDMEESFGITTCRKHSLLVVPRPHGHCS